MYIFEELNRELEKSLFKLTSEMIQLKNQYTNDVYKRIASSIVPERSILFDDKQSGKSFGDDIYDGWPGHCHRKMVMSMYGNLCPSNTNWMEFQLPAAKQVPRQISMQLETLNKQFMSIVRKTNFYGNQTQFISDGVGFGNGVQYIKDDVQDKRTRFVGVHPAQYYVDTDDDNEVKAVLRKVNMKYLDLIKTIQSSTMKETDYEKCLPADVVQNIDNNGYMEDIEIYHICFDVKYYKDLAELPEEYVGTAPYAAVWYISANGKSGQVFAIDRHMYFPFIIWRYWLESGWSYGFGPGHYALHDSEVLQQLSRGMLEAGQRAIAPPLQAPEEMKNKIHNRPYGMTYYEDASRLVQGLYQQVNWPIAQDVFQSRRDLVGKHYMLDVWQTLSEITARMTAYEVSERLGEKMSMISAIIGNFLQEGLSKQVAYLFTIEQMNGRIVIPPELDEYMKKEGLKIEYLSLLSQSLKKHLENQGLMRTITEMQMVFELNQEIRLAFDWYAVARRLIQGSTTSHDVLKDEREYKQELDMLKQQQQQAMQAQAMQNQAKMGGGNAQGMV